MFQRLLPWKARLKGSAPDDPMVDDFEESAQFREAPRGDAGEATIEHVGRKSYAARLRMIILLSVICWAMVIGGIVWVAG